VTTAGHASRADAVDSTFAWVRLAVALVPGTVGSVGMWSFVVALPAVQVDFGILRADASLPYTTAIIGFACGGAAIGRLADRCGIFFPVVLGALLIGMGYIASGFAPNVWTLAAMHFVIGLGASATFGPIVADTSHWFRKHRGVAIAIASCGNSLSGAIWPPVVQHFITSDGWRATHIGVGVFALLVMLPLALMMRRPAPVAASAPSGGGESA
jgi:MFS family permease